MIELGQTTKPRPTSGKSDHYAMSPLNLLAARLNKTQENVGICIGVRGTSGEILDAKKLTLTNALSPSKTSFRWLGVRKLYPASSGRRCKKLVRLKFIPESSALWVSARDTRRSINHSGQQKERCENSCTCLHVVGVHATLSSISNV